MLGSKPLASLSSGLLARKGTAKPAMRSQGFGGFAPQLAHPAALEDLGWNDMGGFDPDPVYEPAPPSPVASPPVALVQPAPVETSVEPEPVIAPSPVPPVLAMREALKEEVEKDPALVEAPEPAASKPISLATAQRIGRDSAKQTKGGKAAFTLRLESDRHLRLRLASALANRSAQQLVTDAVDAFLMSMPEVDTLIAELPNARRARR